MADTAGPSGAASSSNKLLSLHEGVHESRRLKQLRPLVLSAVLESTDNKVWVEIAEEGQLIAEEISGEIATLSPYVQRQLIKHARGSKQDEPIQLPKQVDRKTLGLVLEYAKFHSATGRSDKERKVFDERFIRLDTRTLCELTSSADALDIKPLVDLTSRALARMIEGKSPEEIRETFNLPDDLTEEEKLEPVKTAGLDPRIRLLNKFYARKRKELAERKRLTGPDAGGGGVQEDTRSVEELLSFIENGADGGGGGGGGGKDLGKEGTEAKASKAKGKKKKKKGNGAKVSSPRGGAEALAARRGAAAELALAGMRPSAPGAAECSRTAGCGTAPGGGAVAAVERGGGGASTSAGADAVGGGGGGAGSSCTAREALARLSDISLEELFPEDGFDESEGEGADAEVAALQAALHLDWPAARAALLGGPLDHLPAAQRITRLTSLSEFRPRGVPGTGGGHANGHAAGRGGDGAGLSGGSDDGSCSGEGYAEERSSCSSGEEEYTSDSGDSGESGDEERVAMAVPGVTGTGRWRDGEQGERPATATRGGDGGAGCSGRPAGGDCAGDAGAVAAAMSEFLSGVGLGGVLSVVRADGQGAGRLMQPAPREVRRRLPCGSTLTMRLDPPSPS